MISRKSNGRNKEGEEERCIMTANESQKMNLSFAWKVAQMDNQWEGSRGRYSSKTSADNEMFTMKRTSSGYHH